MVLLPLLLSARKLLIILFEREDFAAAGGMI